MGREIDALKIFTICIQYMINRICEKLSNNGINGITLQDIDIILNLPDIWDDTAKTLLTEAAQKYGIRTDQLKIILKSDAAFIYCQYMHLGKGELEAAVMTPGFKFMVIDIGGETTDISVYKKISSTKIKQVTIPLEMSWGGKTIYDAYWQFFCDLLGEKNMKQFKEECMEDYLGFFERFESLTMTCPSNRNKDVRILIPNVMQEILDTEVSEAISSSKYKDIIKLVARRYTISFTEFEKLFDETIENIKSRLNEMWDENDFADVQTVLLVGDCACNYFIQNMMKKHLLLRNKRLILPNNPSVAVLRGAVWAGHVPFTKIS
uniref:Uncharacterized protein LOC111123449 isoform X2 n=1 Tax=Crassostrea virginica TaxID=6565 RepID=A0A8B8D071_CRAVI|nr:uncharacterized protein LOC111123449 isoform X2 [Crassostrea virginica]